MQTFDILDAGERNRYMVGGRIVSNCTGNGPQPTNMPRGSLLTYSCACGKHHTQPANCPWCGAATVGKPDEWNPDAMDSAIEVMASGSLELVEHVFGQGNALAAMAGCLRGMFVAADGHDLVSSDYTAIEAVVLACLAGEQWRIDLFHNKGKIYEASGAKVGGVTYESLIEYKRETGKHHPLRQVGKTCLGADTLVLTQFGWVRIYDVRRYHKLWDGIEWVDHAGCLPQGEKQCISFDGVSMTEDHRIYVAENVAIEARNLSGGEKAQAYAFATFPSVEGWPDGGLIGSKRKGVLPGKKASRQQVYDLVNAGPRRRFTIRTRKGPLIVSNCELALGYGGWIGGWLAFDKSGRQDDEIKRIILAWREASPAIVEFWGGQVRRDQGWKSELFGVEGAFIRAALLPGVPVNYRGFTFTASKPAFPVRCPAASLSEPCTVQITLLSGRKLTYHNVLLEPTPPDQSWKGKYAISYEGYNTNLKNGGVGWIRMRTYAGKLVENLCQSVANDILRYAMANLERAGYPIVLHVYDEIVCEVPKGFGSVEELESIMKTIPSWAAGWPIGADGGWRGRRYRKG